MRRVVVLLPIVTNLVLGCSGTCPEQDAERATVTWRGSWETLVAVLDEEGRLAPTACDALCAGLSAPMEVETVYGCRFPDSVQAVEPPESADTSIPEDTSDTAPPLAPVRFEVECDVSGVWACKGGRHHASIAGRHPVGCEDPLGQFFAESWLAEATSVQAFLALADELEAFGAPVDLVARSRDAACDEVVHARLLAPFARDRGATLGTAAFRATPHRDLLAFAIENAVEGCVRETYAAFVAAHQSVAAAAAYAPAYRVIAQDEIRHAELAWAIDAWLVSQLGRADRAHVEEARKAAVTELFAGIRDPEPGSAAAGRPSAAESRRLLDGLVAQLWAALAA